MQSLGYTGYIGYDEKHPFKVGQALFWKDSFQDVKVEQHYFHDLARPYVEVILSQGKSYHHACIIQDMLDQ